MSTHAVMELTEEISDVKESKNYAVRVFIDLKRFRYSRSWNTYQQLNYYSMRGVANDWNKSYLSNMKQFLNIDLL